MQMRPSLATAELFNTFFIFSIQNYILRAEWKPHEEGRYERP